MSLGASMAGGNPRAGRNLNDFYPTPPEATHALIDHYCKSIPGVVWEPACGNGAISHVFKSRGYQVISTDLNDYGYGTSGHDFTVAFDLNGAEAIVTNPPFNTADKFIRAAQRLNPQFFALLLKSTYYHAKSRYPLFRDYPPTGVHPLTWRLDFMNKGRPTMECSWFVWCEQAGNQYEPLLKPKV